MSLQWWVNSLFAHIILWRTVLAVGPGQSNSDVKTFPPWRPVKSSHWLLQGRFPTIFFKKKAYKNNWKAALNPSWSWFQSHFSGLLKPNPTVLVHPSLPKLLQLSKSLITLLLQVFWVHTNLLDHSPVFRLSSIPLHCELDEMNAFITAGKEETSPRKTSSHPSTKAAVSPGVSWPHSGTSAGLP